MDSRGTKKVDLPIHSLGVGLRNQDIHKVSVFCKEADHVFMSFWQRVDRITSASSASAQPPKASVVKHLHYHNDTLEMYKTGLNLILSTAKDYVLRSQHISFIQEVLQIVQDHLSKGVKQVMTNLQKVQVGNLTNGTVEKQSDFLLTLITDIMLEIREQNTLVKKKLLQLQQQRQLQQQQRQSAQASGRERRGSGSSVLSFLEGAIGGSGVGSGGGPGASLIASFEGPLTEAQRQMMVTWDSLDERAVIVEGILAGEIQFLQKYLTHRYGPDSSEWMHVINTGLGETLIFLQEKEMTYASKMLQNMGFDVRTKLRQICLYTTEKSLRDYLAQELQSLNALTQDEVEMIKFLHQMEELYSCPSFNVAKLLRTESVTGEIFPDPLNLQSSLPSPQYESLVEYICGDMAEMDVQNSETAHYSHTLLEWVRGWDTETKQRIIVDRAVHKKDIKAEIIEDIPAAVLWNYFCTRQNIQRLREWIDTQYPLQNKEVLVEPTWPYNLPISKEMVDNMNGATELTCEHLLNDFAKRGIFCTHEQESFDILLSRLRKIQSILGKPHLIEKSDDPLILGMQDFHRHMLQFCIRKQMPELLYFYLDYWSLCVMSTNLDQFHLEDQAPPWVGMLLHFRNASRQQFDPDTVFQATLSASRCVQNLNNTSIHQLVEDGMICTALATLMYSQDKLKQFLANPPDKAKQNLMNSPTLFQAFFDKEALNKHATITTVYQLLQGNIPFDPSKLFGWQSTNKSVTEDVMRELPHFSHQELARKYGHKESLQFTYFIKQGRPCFAFANFIIEEMKMSESGHLSTKRIEKACLKVHSLGIQHFMKTQITAACAAFMEMLGQDSTTFRVHIQTANEIFAGKFAGVPGNIDDRKQIEQVTRERIASNLQNCLRQKKKYVEEVLTDLVAAIQWFISKKHIQRSSHIAEHKWLLALAFCRCHGLLYTSLFLEDCAKEDDWLRFLTHAQAYQYSPHQVQEVIPSFKSYTLREHMKFIINNMTKAEEQKTKQAAGMLTFQKDFRARLYAKVGVSKDLKENQSSTDEEDIEMTSLDYEQPCQTSDSNVTIKDQYKIDIGSENLFDLLLACQKTPYPAKILCRCGVQHRNSVLPVLAACYEDSNMLECLCTWLYSSLSSISDYTNTEHPHTSDSTTTISPDPPQTGQNQLRPDTASGKMVWSLSDLYELVHKGMNTSQMVLVYDGFYIFFPHTVLLPFLRCIAKFYQQEDLSVLKHEMESFRQQLDRLKFDKETLDCKLFPVTWLVELVLSVIKYMICHLTDDDVGKFLQLLDETKMTNVLSGLEKVPDISLLHRLHLQTKDTDIHINFKHLLHSPTETCTSTILLEKCPFEKEWNRIVHDLQTRGHWNEARVAAELIGLTDMDITLNQLNANIENLKNSGVWEYNEVQSEFWKTAEVLLTRHDVDAITAAKFFHEQADQSCRSSTKEHLYQLAYNWWSKESTETTHSLDLFTHIWKAKITKVSERDEIFNPVTSSSALAASKKTKFDKSQLRKLEKLSNSTQGSFTELLSPEEKGALEVLLEELLDKGKLSEVMKVANHFKHPCQDLNIILTCHKLAKGEIAPETLDQATKKLLSSARGAPRLRKKSLQMVTLPRLGSRLSIASQMSELGDVFMDEDNVLSCIQLLSQQCTHGKHCCDFMLLVYQVAKKLEIEYQEALAVDEFSLLGHIIKSDLHTKYILAKSFIQASCIPDTQIAGFLCNVVVEDLQLQLGLLQPSEFSSSSSPHRPGTTTNKPSVSPSGLTISEIIQLCDNPALLGQRLLNYVVSMNSTEIESNIATLSLEVELLIYAHDCFTISCHMEGISDLLRTCRTVVQMMNSAEEYPLLVRLLTSVGRYSEMVYIFDILKQQHQFELLFRKGTDKESKLKLAILDYLQRYHPDDTDTYTMVALHFTMYREIAHMLEKAAQKLLHEIQEKTIENIPENQAKLQKALHYLSDAAESYVKENCLRHAEDCVKQAKLVALQIQFLPSKIRIINMGNDGLRAFVRTHKKIHEVRLVLDAYSQHDLWTEALYTNLIKQGDIRYLNEVVLYIKLTPSLVTDIAERFRSDVQQTKQSTSNMHKLLKQCPDSKTALILANRLDMKETASELMKGQNGAYLKDCAANKTV